VSGQSAEAVLDEAVLDSPAADSALRAPSVDVLEATQADISPRPAGTVRYSTTTEGSYAATPDYAAARAALGGTTTSSDPGGQTAEARLNSTTADAGQSTAADEPVPEPADSTREDSADNDGANTAADGEPSDVVTRPTNVTETLTATALVPEVLPAPAVWDADRAVTEIYLGEYKSLVRLAVLLVHDVQTAEEVVQDAFEAMHTAWRRLRDSEKALSYLRQAVVNRARSVLRHRTVVDKNAPKPAPDEPSAEQAAMTLIERSAVVDALRTLPERQREAIVLRYYADLSEADIAATMGISKGAVKSHTARAMAALKSILEQETT
jgi:RNA polymerase sigma-70 factor (sigma-E family)